MNQRLRLLLIAILAVAIGLTSCNAERADVGAATVGMDALLPLTHLVVDPSDQSLLTATVKGVYRSHDSGRTWQRLPIPASLSRANFSHVVMAAGSPATLYVSGQGVGVLRSDDRGQTWRTAAKGLPSKNTGAMTAHSTDPASAFVWVKDEGVYRTDDGGANWRFVHEGPSLTHLTLLVHSPLEGSMNTGWLYGGTPDGVYLTSDCL